MAVQVHTRVVDHGFGRLLKQATIAHSGVVARTLTRVALDVREAEADMVGHSFDFWSSITRNFLASEKSFPFQPATKSRLEARVWAGTKSSGKRGGKLRDIFYRHEFGFTLRPSERARLVLGRSPASYAVPTKEGTARLRQPSARVRPSDTPAALLGVRGGGFARFKPRRRSRKGVGVLSTHVFVTPGDKAIMEVTPTGQRRLLYGLYSRDIPVEEHIEFFDTAARVVGQRLLPKLLQEWDRGIGRFGA